MSSKDNNVHIISNVVIQRSATDNELSEVHNKNSCDVSNKPTKRKSTYVPVYENEVRIFSDSEDEEEFLKQLDSQCETVYVSRLSSRQSSGLTKNSRESLLFNKVAQLEKKLKNGCSNKCSCCEEFKELVNLFKMQTSVFDSPESLSEADEEFLEILKNQENKVSRHKHNGKQLQQNFTQKEQINVNRLERVPDSLALDFSDDHNLNTLSPEKEYQVKEKNTKPQKLTSNKTEKTSKISKVSDKFMESAELDIFANNINVLSSVNNDKNLNSKANEAEKECQNITEPYKSDATRKVEKKSKKSNRSSKLKNSHRVDTLCSRTENIDRKQQSNLTETEKKCQVTDENTDPKKSNSNTNVEKHPKTDQDNNSILTPINENIKENLKTQQTEANQKECHIKEKSAKPQKSAPKKITEKYSKKQTRLPKSKKLEAENMTPSSKGHSLEGSVEMPSIRKSKRSVQPTISPTVDFELLEKLMMKEKKAKSRKKENKKSNTLIEKAKYTKNNKDDSKCSKVDRGNDKLKPAGKRQPKPKDFVIFRNPTSPTSKKDDLNANFIHPTTGKMEPNYTPLSKQIQFRSLQNPRKMRKLYSPERWLNSEELSRLFIPETCRRSTALGISLEE